MLFHKKAARGFLANIDYWFQIRRFNDLKMKPYHVYRVLRLDMGKKKEHLSWTTRIFTTKVVFIRKRFFLFSHFHRNN